MRQDAHKNAATGSRRRFAASRLGERGSVAVEAALIFPVLIILAMGIAEFTLLLRDYVATSSLVRAGARTASALPRDAQFLTATTLAVAQSGSSLPKGSLQELWVYDANSDGFPGNSGNRDFEEKDCSTGCVRYKWNSAAQTFSLVGGSWPSTKVNACLGDPQASSVGVYVKAQHSWLTKIFFDTTTIQDRSVMNFEPITGMGIECK